MSDDLRDEEVEIVETSMATECETEGEGGAEMLVREMYDQEDFGQEQYNQDVIDLKQTAAELDQIYTGAINGFCEQLQTIVTQFAERYKDEVTKSSTEINKLITEIHQQNRKNTDLRARLAEVQTQTVKLYEMIRGVPAPKQ